MLLDRRAASGENIAGNAHFNRNLSFRQMPHQFRILHRMQPVADALGLQLAQRFPDGFRPNCLSSVHGQTQTVLRSVLVHLTELLRGSTALVSSQTDSNNISVFEANGFAHYALRFVSPEVADRVEDPI